MAVEYGPLKARSTWASSTRGRFSAEIYYMIAKTFTYRELPLNLLIFLRAVLLLSTTVRHRIKKQKQEP